MTTVINNPGNGEGSSGSVGIIIALVILVVAVGLFFVYGLPAIRGNSAPKNGVNIDVTLPAGENSGTSGQGSASY